jgi:tRNA nucleotidyltransferase (CCA-adding enzyme)
VSPAPVPSAILELLRTLGAHGHQAVLVGGCVRDALRGEPARDWDVATSAASAEILQLFPRAVAIGGAHGTAMVPCSPYPVDVTPFREASLEGDLAHRDFSVNAIAWDPLDDVWWDPMGGRDDLSAAVLRAAGDPEARLREDPLRALRAARLATDLGLAPDTALRAALPGAARGLQSVPAERVRAELDRLLAADVCAPGVELLRVSGIEAMLFPDTRDDALELLRTLPRDRDLRLAAWLRGTRASRLLSKWRFPKQRAKEIAFVLSVHPVEEHFQRDAGARRLRRRAGSEVTLRRTLILRRHELALGGEDTDALEQLEAALARTEGNALTAADLALDGLEVGTLLDLEPGPIIGRALRFLVECVIEDPDRNTPERLAALLRSEFAESER